MSDLQPGPPPAGNDDDPPPLPAEVSRYVWWWMLGACVAAGAAGALLPWPTAASLRADGGVALILVLLSLAANQLQVRIRHGQVMETFQLDEAVLAASFLLLPPMLAIGVVALGVVIHQMIDQREPVKIVYNVATVAAGTSIGVAVAYQVVGEIGADISLGEAGAAFIAAGCYMVVNNVAIAGLVKRLEGRSVRRILRERMGLTLFIAATGASVGIPFAVLWRTDPVLSPLVLLPVVIVTTSYRAFAERRSDMAVLASERDRLDRMVAGASDGIVLLAADGRVEVWNPAMERLTGVPETDAAGRPLDDLIVAATSGGLEVDPTAPMFRATPAQPRVEQELTIAGPDGAVRVVQIRHSVLFDGRRRLAGDVMLLHDVTREREIEAIKEDLVARVSHELRTPLTPILGFAQVLRTRGEDLDAEQRRSYAETIERQAGELWKLIGGLLATSEIEAGASGDKTQRLGLAPMLQDLADRAGDDVTAVISTADVHVDADREQLEQVFESLLVNAIRYGRPPVLLELDRDGDEAVVRVRDHGDGVPEDFVPKLFERFTQASTGTTRRATGLGLGLYLVKVYTEAHGGRVRYEHNDPCGACFVVALPAVSSGPRRPTARPDVRG